jgi:hypothetical protein
VHIASATEIYSRDLGAVYSLTTEKEVWSCDSARLGTAAASYAVFVSYRVPHKVLFDTY